MGVTSGNINLGMETSTTQNFNKAGVTIPAGQSRDFCIPVALSGVIGAGLTKYLPIGKVTDLRAEFTLEDAVRAVVSSGTAVFTINSPVLSFPRTMAFLSFVARGRALRSSTYALNLPSLRRRARTNPRNAAARMPSHSHACHRGQPGQGRVHSSDEPPARYDFTVRCEAPPFRARSAGWPHTCGAKKS